MEKKVDGNLSSSEENDRNVKSYLNTKLQIGGFYETAITGITESDANPQVAANSNTLGLNIGAEFSDNLRFASQFINFLNINFSNQHGDPRAVNFSLPGRAEFGTYNFNTLLTQAYLEWGSSEAFNIQVGTGYVPFGITLQQLELVLFVRRNGPQIVNETSIVFPLWQGIHIHGLLPIKNTRVGYNVYTFSPVSNTKVLGGGGRVWWKSNDDKVSAGLSTQVKKVSDDTVKTVGADFKIRADRLTLTTEFAQNYGMNEQPWTIYIEPDFQLKNETIILYTFVDYLSKPNNRTGTGATSLADPFAKFQYGGGVNWLPTSYTRFRTGVTLNQYTGSNALAFGQTRNYVSYDLSAGVAF